MRDKIFREEFQDFNQFVNNFEKLKKIYDSETCDGEQ